MEIDVPISTYYTSSTIHWCSCGAFNRVYSNANWFILCIPKCQIQRGNFTAMWTRDRTRPVYLHIANITFTLFISVISSHVLRSVGSPFPSAVKIYLTVMYYVAKKIGGSSRRVHSNFLGPIKRNCIAPA